MWSKLIFREIDLIFNIPQNIFRNLNACKIAKNLLYNDEFPSHCKLDIFSKRKLKNKKAPVFINIHGGGFVAGDKYFRRGFCHYIAALGFKVININYGLCPEYKYPTFIDHVAIAIKWCEVNADKYHLDMNQVIISGDSAGAYIASTLCVCSQNEEYSNALGITKFDTKFLGTALFCGPYLPSEAFEKKLIFNLNKLLWRDLTGENVENLSDISNYKYYKYMDAVKYTTCKFPPTFITHSEKDIFCLGHAPKFINILKNNHIPLWEVHSLDDLHDWHTVKSIRSSKTTLHEFERFLLVLMSGKLTSAQDISIMIRRGRIVVLPADEIKKLPSNDNFTTDTSDTSDNDIKSNTN